jgi:hypothetical protein
MAMNTHANTDDDLEKSISELAKRIKENGDLLRNAIGQSWADSAIDEIRTDAVEIQRLVARISSSRK